MGNEYHYAKYFVPGSSVYTDNFISIRASFIAGQAGVNNKQQILFVNLTSPDNVWSSLFARHGFSLTFFFSLLPQYLYTAIYFFVPGNSEISLSYFPYYQ